MSDTVKLIIEIHNPPKNDHERWVLAHGISLDGVKAEIAEEICLTDNPYTKETKYTIEHSKLLEILDNIGKAESEIHCNFTDAEIAKSFIEDVEAVEDFLTLSLEDAIDYS